MHELFKMIEMLIDILLISVIDLMKEGSERNREKKYPRTDLNRRPYHCQWYAPNPLSYMGFLTSLHTSIPYKLLWLHVDYLVIKVKLLVRMWHTHN